MKLPNLTNVEIENFKSIKHANIAFGPLTVLVGEPGTGKTNLLSAISYLSCILRKDMEYALELPMREVLHKENQTPKPIKINASFGDKKYSFSVSEDDTTAHLSYDCPPVQGSCSVLDWDRDNHANTPHLPNNIPILYDFWDIIPARKIAPIYSDNINDYIFDGTNLGNALFAIQRFHPKNYKDIIQTIHFINPDFSDFSFDLFRDYIRLGWYNGETKYQLRHLSDSTLRFACLATLLLQPEESIPAIILLETPELGLSPRAINALADIITETSAKCQIILTTQNPILLDDFDPKDILFVSKDSQGSRYQRLDLAALKPWLDGDYSLGELWMKGILETNLIAEKEQKI